MISSEVQRTLVKSPPELWTELSDPESLARHLGALGEIRITRAEAEKRVDWEADGASGSILIKPSGWGTKVTLSVTREVAVSAPADEPEDTAEIGDAVAEAPAEAHDAVPPASAEADDAVPPASAEADDAVAEAPAEVDDAAAAEVENAVAEPPADSEEDLPAEPSPSEEDPVSEFPRRGFFARLFGRRRRPSPPAAAPAAEPEELDRLRGEESPPAAASAPFGTSAIAALQARFAPEPEAEPLAEPEPEAQAEPEPPTLAGPEADAEPEPPTHPESEPEEPAVAGLEAVIEPAPEEPAVDLAAELRAAEEVAVEEVTALLTSVLDRLGAAHHRPFSRA